LEAVGHGLSGTAKALVEDRYKTVVHLLISLFHRFKQVYAFSGKTFKKLAPARSCASLKTSSSKSNQNEKV